MESRPLWFSPLAPVVLPHTGRCKSSSSGSASSDDDAAISEDVSSSAPTAPKAPTATPPPAVRSPLVRTTRRVPRYAAAATKASAAQLAALLERAVHLEAKAAKRPALEAERQRLTAALQTERREWRDMERSLGAELAQVDASMVASRDRLAQTKKAAGKQGSRSLESMHSSITRRYPSAQTPQPSMARQASSQASTVIEERRHDAAKAWCDGCSADMEGLGKTLREALGAAKSEVDMRWACRYKSISAESSVPELARHLAGAVLASHVELLSAEQHKEDALLDFERRRMETADLESHSLFVFSTLEERQNATQHVIASCNKLEEIAGILRHNKKAKFRSMKSMKVDRQPAATLQDEGKRQRGGTMSAAPKWLARSSSRDSVGSNSTGRRSQSSPRNAEESKSGTKKGQKNASKKGKPGQIEEGHQSEIPARRPSLSKAQTFDESSARRPSRQERRHSMDLGARSDDSPRSPSLSAEQRSSTGRRPSIARASIEEIAGSDGRPNLRRPKKKHDTSKFASSPPSVSWRERTASVCEVESSLQGKRLSALMSNEPKRTFQAVNSSANTKALKKGSASGLTSLTHNPKLDNADEESSSDSGGELSDHSGFSRRPSRRSSFNDVDQDGIEGTIFSGDLWKLNHGMHDCMTNLLSWRRRSIAAVQNKDGNSMDHTQGSLVYRSEKANGAAQKIAPLHTTGNGCEADHMRAGFMEMTPIVMDALSSTAEFELCKSLHEYQLAIGQWGANTSSEDYATEIPYRLLPFRISWSEQGKDRQLVLATESSQDRDAWLLSLRKVTGHEHGAEKDELAEKLPERMSSVRSLMKVKQRNDKATTDHWARVHESVASSCRSFMPQVRELAELHRQQCERQAEEIDLCSRLAHQNNPFSAYLDHRHFLAESRLQRLHTVRQRLTGTALVELQRAQDWLNENCKPDEDMQKLSPLVKLFEAFGHSSEDSQFSAGTDGNQGGARALWSVAACLHALDSYTGTELAELPPAPVKAPGCSMRLCLKDLPKGVTYTRPARCATYHVAEPWATRYGGASDQLAAARPDMKPAVTQEAPKKRLSFAVSNDEVEAPN